MTTKLESPLKRQIVIAGEPYVLTISPGGLKLVPKGRRKGYELDWQALVSGEAALATALNASLANAPEPAQSRSPKRLPEEEKRTSDKPAKPRRRRD